MYIHIICHAYILLYNIFYIRAAGIQCLPRNPHSRWSIANVCGPDIYMKKKNIFIYFLSTHKTRTDDIVTPVKCLQIIEGRYYKTN